jgi:hypothetical protein
MLHTPHIFTLQTFIIILVSIQQEYEEHEGCNHHIIFSYGDYGNNYFSSATTTGKCFARAFWKVTDYTSFYKSPKRIEQTNDSLLIIVEMFSTFFKQIVISDDLYFFSSMKLAQLVT